MSKYLAMDRYKNIEQLLETSDKVSVSDIAKTLYISESTVRRDLQIMQSLGMIYRIRGGALKKDGTNESSIFLRKEKNITEKANIGKIARSHFPDFSSIFIDNSSTSLAFLRQYDFSYKTVVTNGLQCALELSKNDKCNLILLGGKIGPQTNSTEGPFSLQMLKSFHLDLMLSSCAGIKKDGTYEVSPDTNLLKQEVFNITDKHILLLGKTKFEKEAVYRTNSLKAYDFIYTDADDEILEEYKSLGNFINK